MKLLNCVTSYQRYPYLRNTVESLLEYFRFGDTLVVDNGSTDQTLLRYLEELEGRGLSVMLRSWKGETERPGLNDGMNDAVDFAADRGYDFIQFVQDDMQFMWHDPSILDTVQNVFSSRPDAVQVCPLFSNRINRSAAEELEAIEELNGYRHASLSLRPLGFVPVKQVTEQSFRFVEETVNSQFWWERSYRVYYLHSPVLAWIPWPSSFLNGEQQNSIRPPAEKYYLKPLSPRQIGRLAGRPLSQIPYHEDYCRPWGWACLTPYWFFGRRDYQDYVHHILAAWRHRSPTVPRWTFSGIPHYFRPGPGVYGRLIKEAVGHATRKVF